MNQSRSARFWNRFCSVAMVLAPLMQAVGMSVRPRSADLAWTLANPGADLIYGVTGIVAALLYFPAYFGLVRLLSDRNRWFGYIGGLLALVGSVGFTMLGTLILASNNLLLGFGEPGKAAAQALRQIPLVGPIYMMFLGGMVLGMIVLTVGIFREHRTLRFPVGIIWAFVAYDMTAPAPILHLDLAHVLLAIGMGWIGIAGPSPSAQAEGPSPELVGA